LRETAGYPGQLVMTAANAINLAGAAPYDRAAMFDGNNEKWKIENDKGKSQVPTSP
jgi:hypothetical protein